VSATSRVNGAGASVVPRRPPDRGRVRSHQPRAARHGEAIIATGLKPASWTYAEDYVGEDEVLTAARGRATEVGVSPIGAGGGAALRLLASVVGARAVVEIGTGTGVSGVWLLRGMRPDGILTTVDTQAEHQRLARTAFTEAGFPSQRVRQIPAPALEVLPRLTDAAYDLVFADGDKNEYAD
jgi:predicted O-methyltransferase YrrM